jgi:hypothetical protein
MFEKRNGLQGHAVFARSYETSVTMGLVSPQKSAISSFIGREPMTGGTRKENMKATQQFRSDAEPEPAT